LFISRGVFFYALRYLWDRDWLEERVQSVLNSLDKFESNSVCIEVHDMMSKFDFHLGERTRDFVASVEVCLRILFICIHDNEFTFDHHLFSLYCHYVSNLRFPIGCGSSNYSVKVCSADDFHSYTDYDYIVLPGQETEFCDNVICIECKDLDHLNVVGKCLSISGSYGTNRFVQSFGSESGVYDFFIFTKPFRLDSDLMKHVCRFDMMAYLHNRHRGISFPVEAVVRPFFGEVEHDVPDYGTIVQLKASNAHFHISNKYDVNLDEPLKVKKTFYGRILYVLTSVFYSDIYYLTRIQGTHGYVHYDEGIGYYGHINFADPRSLNEHELYYLWSFFGCESPDRKLIGVCLELHSRLTIMLHSILREQRLKSHIDFGGIYPVAVGPMLALYGYLTKYRHLPPFLEGSLIESLFIRSNYRYNRNTPDTFFDSGCASKELLLSRLIPSISVDLCDYLNENKTCVLTSFGSHVLTAQLALPVVDSSQISIGEHDFIDYDSLCVHREYVLGLDDPVFVLSRTIYLSRRDDENDSYHVPLPEFLCPYSVRVKSDSIPDLYSFFEFTKVSDKGHYICEMTPELIRNMVMLLADRDSDCFDEWGKFTHIFSLRSKFTYYINMWDYRHNIDIAVEKVAPILNTEDRLLAAIHDFSFQTAAGHRTSDWLTGTECRSHAYMHRPDKYDQSTDPFIWRGLITKINLSKEFIHSLHVEFTFRQISNCSFITQESKVSERHSTLAHRFGESELIEQFLEFHDELGSELSMIVKYRNYILSQGDAVVNSVTFDIPDSDAVSPKIPQVCVSEVVWAECTDDVLVIPDDINSNGNSIERQSLDMSNENLINNESSETVRKSRRVRKKKSKKSKKSNRETVTETKELMEVKESKIDDSTVTSISSRRSGYTQPNVSVQPHTDEQTRSSRRRRTRTKKPSYIAAPSSPYRTGSSKMQNYFDSSD
jgi:hypothetical protein